MHFVAGTQLPPWPEIKVVKRYDDGSYDASVPWLSGMWLPKHIVGLFGKALPLDPPEYAELGIAYPSVKKLSPAAKQFVKYLRDYIEG